MTTAGSNGVPEGQGGGAPQDDDPFGYLYRPAEGSPAPAEPQQGVPRTSYSRPMEVGRAQYGQAPRGPQAPYEQQGYPQPYGQQGQQGQAPYGQQPQYGQQQVEYGAAPTQQSRYAEHSRPQPGEERPGGGSSSGRSKGAVIGAVAVVAAIAIGAGIALSGSDQDTDKNAKGGTSTVAPPAPATRGAGPSGTGTPSASASSASGTGTVDAGQLQAQNAPLGNTVKGAKSADGSYLTLQQGGTVTWTGDVPAAGTYKLNVHYNYAGADIKGAVSVNGKDWPSGITYKVYGAAPKDQTAAWFNTWILPQFQAGSNTVAFTVPSGPVLIDQITIEPYAG